MFGTNTTLDTLAASIQTIAEFGMDRAFDAVEDAFNRQNAILRQQLMPFCTFSTDRLRRAGTPPDNAIMHKLSEFGSPRPQKTGVGAPVGFPLEQYGAALQWTRRYMRRRKANEFAAQVRNIMTADVRNIQNAIKRALYNPTNYNFDDYLVDHLQQIQLPVKALANADGMGLPIGPNGEVFNASTHTHYLVAAAPGTFAAADGTALVETVLEHYNEGMAQLLINRAQETAVRGWTGFVGYLDARVVGQTTAPQAPGTPLNPIRLYNRPIGVYDGNEVWVKPWVPAGYPIAVMADQPPLLFREPEDETGDLRLESEDERFPLAAQEWVRMFGVGVWDRVSAAVLDIAHGSYTAPVFT